VFFRNSQCLACKSRLGYEPNLAKLCPLEEAGPSVWRLADGSGSDGKIYRYCANVNTASGCNWLVEAKENASDPNGFCLCCRLDRTIPDLSFPANAEYYARISAAKRRLVSLLVALHLPVASRVAEDPERGLAFDFLRSPEGGPRVMTGHDNGIITLNVEEADDSTRERTRGEMGEAYRTLLGHLRHEVGHYYWDRLIAGTVWIDDFRKLFGDERQDYAAALQTHYQRGPAQDWPERFVSAYAGAHPWEDWAESWAHYLHILDTFDTANSFGLDPEASIEVDVEPFGPDALYKADDAEANSFLPFINSWVRLTAVLNELSRGMGLADFYPFVLSRRAVAKLQFVQMVIAQNALGECAAAAASAPCVQETHNGHHESNR
jgi:hypothetical protein